MRWRNLAAGGAGTRRAAAMRAGRIGCRHGIASGLEPISEREVQKLGAAAIDHPGMAVGI